MNPDNCSECGVPIAEHPITDACAIAQESRPERLDVERLAAGIQAALTIRLIAGNVDQTYTPNEVATMVASIVREQLARLVAERA